MVKEFAGTSLVSGFADSDILAEMELVYKRCVRLWMNRERAKKQSRERPQTG
jgi:hypothetical protein